MDKPQLYLATRSPRRRTLIEQLGIPFETLDVDIDERPQQGEESAGYVARLAVEKARAGWDQVSSRRIPVVGADTCIMFNDRIIGKVENRQDGIALLKQFSVNSHAVLTGIAMVGPALVGTESESNNSKIKECVRVNTSKITFRAVTDEECENYWNTGEPLGKAGGYAIQGIAGAFIEKLEGSYSSVMGLPLCELTELMHEFGIKWYDAHNEPG